MVCSFCRLEKIVFGNPSDIINNLSDDKSETKIKDKPVDICTTIINNSKDEDIEDNEDNEDESDQDVSVLYHSDDTEQKKKKPAWIDEDDYNYT